jgi:hypothetical protein
VNYLTPLNGPPHKPLLGAMGAPWGRVFRSGNGNRGSATAPAAGPIATASGSACEDHQCGGRGQSLITGCRWLSGTPQDRRLDDWTRGVVGCCGLVPPVP